MTILEYEPKLKPPPSPRSAELALLFATMVWGSSFTWAKASGDAINRISGAGAGAMVGPLLLMGVRFILGGVLWMILFPRARRGWSWPSVGRGAILGLLLGCGLILQVLGLDRTTEAVSAFLTSLTILWVPALMTVWMRKPPSVWYCLGVGLAGWGIWLMTGAMPTGFGAGERLGLACSIAFSFHIIVLNVLVPRDSPGRITGAQLLVAGFLAMGFCLCVPAGRQAAAPAQFWTILRDPAVCSNLLLLIAFPTIISFGIMSYFQPRVEPTRATLIYLLEPIFAAGYAWITIGRGLGASELLGAGLILAANGVVEVLAVRPAPSDRGEAASTTHAT
jgi:drug/metabolite transporter (DMT)-like permease